MKIASHACMCGARRDKNTSLVTNAKCLQAMQVACTHPRDYHLPWGAHLGTGDHWTFATAGECEYPVELREAIADLIASELGVTRPGSPP